MLAFSFDNVSIKADSFIKAPTKAVRENKPMEAQITDAMREYVALYNAGLSLRDNLIERAAKLLASCVDKATLEKARVAFGGFYEIDYKGRFPKNTQEQMIGARDMAWKRTKENAVKGGWKAPVTAPATGKTPAKKTPATDKRKLGNNTAKGKLQKVKVESTSEAMAHAVETVKQVDTDLAAALAWVRESAENMGAFKAWYKAQREAQANGKSAVIAVVTDKKAA